MPHSKHDPNDQNLQRVLADRRAKAKILGDQWDTLTELQRWQACSNPEFEAIARTHFPDAQAYARWAGGEGEYAFTADFCSQPLDPLIVATYHTDQGHQNPDPKKHGAHGPKQG